jgi:predicted dehydrogenase
MNKKYRVGIIGFGHMHINDVAAHYAQHPQVEWAACADTRPIVSELREAPYTRGWNLKHAMNNLGVPKAYEDYHEMLAKEDLDIAIICSENAQHPDIVEACARFGTHVCVEKPMAASLPDALRMVRACQAAQTTLLVNWPITWSPQAHKVKELIEQGAIGRVLEVKFRSGHTGPLGPGAAHAGVSETAAPMTGPERGATWWHQKATGGGAMLDYCCYGAMVSRWLIGEQATAAFGMKANLDSQWGDAEDNAAMLVRFPGAMSLLEGSWTTLDHGVAGGPIVLGTTGTLVMDYSEQVCLKRGHGQVECIDCDPLPAGRQDVAQEFIHHLETGDPLHKTLEMLFNLEAMAILDAGIQSASSGKVELIDNAAWRIG